MLATGAVALGVGVAWAGMQLLQAQGATYFPRTQEIRFDAPMMWLMAGLAISSALIFGLVPALHATGGSGGCLAAIRPNRGRRRRRPPPSPQSRRARSLPSRRRC